jgi:hypothetical protein
MIREKIEEYLKRAEALKGHLTSDNKPKKAVGANGAGKQGCASSYCRRDPRSLLTPPP